MKIIAEIMQTQLQTAERKQVIECYRVTMAASKFFPSSCSLNRALPPLGSWNG